MSVRWIASFALAAVAAVVAIAFYLGAFSGSREPMSEPASAAVAPERDEVQAPPDEAAVMPTGPATDKQSFGDWIYGCVPLPGGTSQCMIANQFLDAKTKAVIFRWTIARKDGALIAVWRTPTGVLIDRGLVVDAGTPKPVKVPFNDCAGGACRAVARLGPDFVTTLSNTRKATATIYGTNGDAVVFEISVIGLSAALEKLRQ